MPLTNAKTNRNSYQHHYSNNAEMSQYPLPLDSSGPQLTVEEHELRRQRNTAASARFRAKKKRREQSLERNVREEKEKLTKLESRIIELEAENRWLKNLIMEENDTAGEDIAALKKHTIVADGGEGCARKDKVGAMKG